MNRRVICVIAALLFSPPVWAGSYFGSIGLPACIDPACAPDDCPCDPFIIVHPIGYTGTGGTVEIDVCIKPDATTRTTPAVVEAIDIWNAFTSTTGNCEECRTAEETGPTGDPFILSATILHELGHCAMGLGHSNYTDLTGPTAVTSNFTNSRNVALFDDGPDNIKGSRDDVATPPPPSPPEQTLVLHWYRKSDNDPVVIDGTVIDQDTFTRTKIDLPPGSTWQANANRFVSDLLGAGDDTQTVMHTTAAENMFYTGITADDSNSVRYGMAGLDSVAGTADDYTINLNFVDDCAAAEVEVEFTTFSDTAILAGCAARLNPIDPVMPAVGYIHHAVEPVTTAGVTRLLLQLSDTVRWDVVFSDGFETGDLSNWSTP